MKQKKILIGLIAVLLILVGAYIWGDAPEQVIETVNPTPSAPAVQEKTPEPLPSETSASPSATAVPTEAPMTEEPMASTEPAPENTELFCTLTVRCDDVLNNMDKLRKGKEAIIPEDGIIFPQQNVSFSPGESVFDVLHREMRNRGIHMEFVSTPIYNSVYIEGIGNLYEFDCGDTSGWIYTVNGDRPMHGCSQHEIQNGDKIEFVYRCSLYGG